MVTADIASEREREGGRGLIEEDETGAKIDVEVAI